MLLALRHRLEFLVFQVLVCAIDCLSPRAAVRMAERLAWGIHYGLPRKLTRFAVARDNLRTAFGTGLSDAEIDRLVYRMWVHLFRTVVEIVQSVRKLHIHSYRRLIEYGDFTWTNDAVCSGRRVLVLGGHFGNWEIGPTLFGMWGFRLGIVARKMDNPYLDEWFRNYREMTGHRLMMKNGDFDNMTALLEKGGNIGLLCDQDAGPRGLFVDFFGTPASTYKSIALLALEYDALVIVGYSIRLPDSRWEDDAEWSRFEVGCDALIDPRELQSNDPVGEITRQFTSALERAIRRAPEQYFWVHRRWKSEPRVKQKAVPERLAG